MHLEIVRELRSRPYFSPYNPDHTATAGERPEAGSSNACLPAAQ